MCRNIKPLFNFEPPATQEEIEASVIQFVRKISGMKKPSSANEAAFEEAVKDIHKTVNVLLNSLVTSASPKNRKVEASKARARAEKRFG